jgi:hypothetical protein
MILLAVLFDNFNSHSVRENYIKKLFPADRRHIKIFLPRMHSKTGYSFNGKIFGFSMVAILGFGSSK